MTISDLAIVFATLLGPILAVQIQKWLDRRAERNRRQVEVFRTLMASRVTQNSPEHVNAYNAVPLEFYKNKAVVDAWKDSFMHLNTDAKVQTGAWQAKRIKLMIALLKVMGDSLHYEFRDAELQDHSYLPDWQLTLMNEQEVLRKGLLALLSGDKPLAMAVTSIALNPEVHANQLKMQEMFIEWMQGERRPAVNVGA